MATSIFSDIRNDILVQLQSSTTLAFYTNTIIGAWIDKAHKWAAGYKKWPQTEGKSSTTFVTTTDDNGDIAFNYPEGWKADSIRFMTIGGKQVTKTNFQKYRRFREDWPSDTKRMFTDYGRVYYVNPNIDLSGTLVVWGQYTPATIDITDDNATTIFSDGAEEANDAIIEKVLSYAKKREKKLKESLAHEQSAKDKLDEYFGTIKDEQFGYQDASNDGIYKRIDVVNGGYTQDILKRDQFNN